MDYIKSPINYTGNKFRILNQIKPYIAQEKGVMVDLFCGGATVGINTNFDKIIFIDNDEKIINLLKFLAKNNINRIITDIERLIVKYKLSYSYKYSYSFYINQISDPNRNNGLKGYNSKGFYLLRADYNSLKNKSTYKANTMLYVLMIYAFNNDIRFNQKGFFNLPVGKTDFNKSNFNKLIDYNKRAQTSNYTFITGDFKSEEIQHILFNSDFIYMDPPYLITEAVYNKTSKWNEESENQLLNLIDNLIINEKQFILSNVMEKFDRRNEPLCTWVENNNKIDVIDVKYHYKSASYNKKNRNSQEREVIILPRRK